MELINPVWWKRPRFWMGPLFAMMSALRVWAGTPIPGWWGWEALWLLLSVFIAFYYGWWVAIITDDTGIRVRRFSRRREARWSENARWSEIERFDDRGAAVAILTDGTKLHLFDWHRDIKRIVAELEDERQRRAGSARSGATELGG